MQENGETYITFGLGAAHLLELGANAESHSSEIMLLGQNTWTTEDRRVSLGFSFMHFGPITFPYTDSGPSDTELHVDGRM